MSRGYDENELWRKKWSVIHAMLNEIISEGREGESERQGRARSSHRDHHLCNRLGFDISFLINVHPYIHTCPRRKYNIVPTTTTQLHSSFTLG